jgi:surface protein
MKKTLLLALAVIVVGCGSDETPTGPPTPIATSITMSPVSLNFGALGDTATIAATVKDAAGTVITGASVTWATSDAAIATVSSAGLVTSVAKGSATITATSGSASATASVTVEEAFSLAANNVTVVCTNAAVGDTGEVGGIEYTKRSEAQIRALVAGDDASLTTTCTSGVTHMNNMFLNARSFDQDISSWDVSNVMHMGWMFHDAESFNQDISSWDVSNVTIMQNMFRSAPSFNQDLSGWCVSQITSKPTDFDTSASSWVLDRPVWGTCP